MPNNKKKAPRTLDCQQGEHQTSGRNNNTTSKELSVLNWIYDRSIRGLTCTALESFSQNLDTSFRTHISVLCRKYGLEIPRKYVKNPNTGASHKEYWLSDSDIEKVKKNTRQVNLTAHFSGGRNQALKK